MSDVMGRPHDIFYQSILLDAPQHQKPNSVYTVELGGTAELAPTVLEGAIVLPNRFTVNDLEDDGPLIAGEDFVVEWTPAATTGFPSDDPGVVGGDVLGVTWLADTTSSVPTHMCVALHSSGTFTIPGETIEEYRAIATARGTNPDQVIMLRNALVHRMEPLQLDSNPRRIDMLGLVTYAQLMTVDAAP
jgi:hypothetical protein